jgi:hypothetical protein
MKNATSKQSRTIHLDSESFKPKSAIDDSFIDAQDTFNQTICQAQAVIIALSGDEQFTYMATDHVSSLLSLTLDSLIQLNASYNDLLTAVKSGNYL